MAGWNLTGASSGKQDRLPWEKAVSEPVAADSTDSYEKSRADAALSVSAAVNIAAGALDSLPTLTVLGEVTGFRGPQARSGHCYFQIKDDSAAVDCIIWKGVYGKRSFDLRNGMQVLFTGNFNVYKATGRMSFVARKFTLAGEGLLRQQVAELAEKLRREGLMEPARKRHIPVFCSRVAIVTSLSGAVIDDVKRTLRRRNPLVELVCVGTKVQGEGAPEQIIEALDRAAHISPAPDCILLVRGGGSFEDLMTFNDEALARAVAACPVPVVTGIGHEPDTSICDMVSDRRASTPTAAAESVAPAISELVDALKSREQRLASSMGQALNRAQTELDTVSARGERAWSTYLDRLSASLDALAQRPCLTDPFAGVRRQRAELEQTVERFAASTASLDTKKQELGFAQTRLVRVGSTLLDKPQAELARNASMLDALSPLKVMGRGYGIAYGKDGVATSAASFAAGDPLCVRLSDGNVYGTVERVDSALEPQGFFRGANGSPADAQAWPQPAHAPVAERTNISGDFTSR